MIYRASSYDFPIGWARDGMTFKEKGGFILYEIAPNKATVKIPGSWKLIDQCKLEVSFTSKNKATQMIEIEKINHKVLMIKKNN